MEVVIALLFWMFAHVFFMAKLARRDFGDIGGIDPGIFIGACVVACIPVAGSIFVFCTWASGIKKNGKEVTWFKNERA